MEKTNSNIPTPEELKAYIDESVISVTGTYEQSALPGGQKKDSLH